MIECAFNMYSAGCWESMNEVFTQTKNSEEILLAQYNASVMLTWAVYFSVGPWLLLIWLVVGIPVIMSAPEQALPPASDDGYAYMDFWQWLWFKYLSLDAQVVLMFVGLATAAKDENYGALKAFQELSFSTWNLPDADLGDRILKYTWYEIIAWF